MTGRERGAAAVLLVVGVIALEEASRLRFGSLARPGPGFFPVVLAAAFSLVCAALLVGPVRTRDADAPPLPRRAQIARAKDAAHRQFLAP